MKQGFRAHLSGRFPWTRGLVLAARRYTREGTEENLRALQAAQRASSEEVVSAQARLGLSYVTDGGAWTPDIFSPYVSGVEGVSSAGNIDKYPGTRNSYYHTPLVSGRVSPGAPLWSRVTLPTFPPGVKKMAVLPSPAAFALASEVSGYASRGDLVADFIGVLRADVEDLAREGFDYIQLNEGFLPNPRFAEAGRALVGPLSKGLKGVFEGFHGRTGLYFHSGDASSLVPRFAGLGLTDLGFDYNTPPGSLKECLFQESLVLGLQNATRKLPDDLLREEPSNLAERARGASKVLRLAEGGSLSLCPSQEFDGLQTYPQAMKRMENLAEGARLAGAGA